ncbi:ADP-ribosylglycohydrolase family protein [Carnobacteriaceae bacterium zg-ZUI252]|nr:ADP-ribosylglycohydrolase family protein [Carnobacteriaceae bacterium zg-ZUI252]MBS4770863.1 ADP-ribosylglycohydrolase family protein [Carnobacteriaceae bacterium zg-ZUI240]
MEIILLNTKKKDIKKKKSKWTKGEITDDTAQFLCVLESITDNMAIDRQNIFRNLKKLDYKYRKNSTSTGKSLSTGDIDFVSYFGLGNGGFSKCLPLVLWHASRRGKKDINYEDIIKSTMKIVTITHGNVSTVLSCIFFKYFRFFVI